MVLCERDFACDVGGRRVERGVVGDAVGEVQGKGGNEWVVLWVWGGGKEKGGEGEGE